MKFVEGYTGFSGETELQSGNYLALAFEATEGAEITIELVGDERGAKTIDDGFAVIRLTENTKPLKVTATLDGETATQTFDLTGLELEEDAG